MIVLRLHYTMYIPIVLFLCLTLKIGNILSEIKNDMMLAYGFLHYTLGGRGHVREKKQFSLN